jgi:hypothetical protein
MKSWYNNPYTNDNPYEAPMEVDIACGSWATGRFFHLAITHDPRATTAAQRNKFYIDGVLVGTAAGGAPTHGLWDRMRIGAPPRVDVASQNGPYSAGGCKVWRYVWGNTVQAQLMCAEETDTYTWPDYNSGISAEVASARVWNRPLLSYEILLLSYVPPSNVGPVPFVMRFPTYLALGWGRTDTIALAVDINFQTTPILTPRLTSSDSSDPAYLAATVDLSPPADVSYSMMQWKWTPSVPTMLVFNLTVLPFPNRVEAYNTPSLQIVFEHTGDTTNFISPPSVSFAPQLLLNSAEFQLSTNVPSQRAGWQAGLLSGTGYDSFQWSVGAVQLPYLSLTSPRDARSVAPWPLTTMSGLGGYSVVMWTMLTFPQAAVPAVLWWTGQAYRPAVNDVLFEVTSPVHRLRLRFFNNSFLLRPVVDCRANVDVPVNRWLHVAFTVDPVGQSKLYMSGIEVASCGFVKGGGGPKSFGPSSDRTAAWIGRSANFAGQLSGGVAGFASYPRQLSEGELQALSASPPRSIGPRSVTVVDTSTPSWVAVQQSSIVSVFPGMETVLGLTLQPQVRSPVWYNSSDGSSPVATCWAGNPGTSLQVPSLTFPPTAATSAGTRFVTIGWNAVLPSVLVDFVSSDVAHFTLPTPFTVLNPLPARVKALASFTLNTQLPSTGAMWEDCCSVTARGVVLFNNTQNALDLYNTADTGSPPLPSTSVLPSTVASGGFTLHGWWRLSQPSSSELAASPTQLLFRWGAAAPDKGIYLSVDSSSGMLIFGGSLDAANSDECSCVSSAGGIRFNVWSPIVVAWDATTGLMRVAVGQPQAQNSYTECTCIGTTAYYPSSAYPRTSCQLGRLQAGASSAAMVRVAAFSYYPVALSRVQAMILVYAAPANLAQSRWSRSDTPANSFLNQDVTVTLAPAAYSTLSGLVTLTPQLQGGGAVTPTQLVWASDQPLHFTFRTPFRDALFQVSFDVSVDTFYFSQPSGFEIACAIGLIGVMTVPQNMLPIQTVSVAFTPQAYVGELLSISFFVNGAPATSSSSSQIQLSPSSPLLNWTLASNTATRTLQLRTDASKGAATYFNFSMLLGGADAGNFLTPDWTNVTISNRALGAHKCTETTASFLLSLSRLVRVPGVISV